MELVALHDRGLTEPLPLAVKTSAAYAAGRLGGVGVEQALDGASRDWRSDYGGERDDRHHRYVWGDDAPLADLLTAAPYDDECVEGETSRFGALACRLWAPLLAAEQVT